MTLGLFIYFNQEVILEGSRVTHGIPDPLTSPNYQVSPQCRAVIFFCTELCYHSHKGY